MNVTIGSTRHLSMTMKKRHGEHAPLISCPAHILSAACWSSRSKSSSLNLEYSFPKLTANLPTDAWRWKDFAFRLECNAFKWRWETIFVGHKISAEILSKHLIMPLISANHLAFSSPDVVGNLPPADLEKVNLFQPQQTGSD